MEEVSGCVRGRKREQEGSFTGENPLDCFFPQRGKVEAEAKPEPGGGLRSLRD